MIKKVGEVLEREYDIFYKEVFEEVRKDLQETPFYKKYPNELTEEQIKSKIYGFRLGYSLTSNSKNIESANIDAFAQAEWPDTAMRFRLDSAVRVLAKVYQYLCTCNGGE